MYKQQFIVDTDSLIKLTKSGLIKDVCKHFKCVITEEVFNETIIEGKKRLYQDAFEIEKLIKNNSIKLKKIGKKEVELRSNIGKGEKSTFALYQKSKKSTIVSDDNTFINALSKEKANFIIPADFITLLKSLNKISSKKALFYLNNMETHIKPKVYLRIKNNIMEEK